MIVIPPYLSQGDRIGMTCPASFLDKQKTESCIEILQFWGFEVVMGNTIGNDSGNYFSASDKDRTTDFQRMLDDKSIKAILCGRGGYGSTRIIDNLDFSSFIQSPKWILGYSDITAFHSHLHAKYSIASIHCPMASAFQTWNKDKEYLETLLQCLTGVKMKYTCKPHPQNFSGKTKGMLVGGNLAMLAHMTGTPSEIETAEKILLIEDIGENFYAIDRMLVQLKRSGKLKQIRGLIAGGFTDMKDTERPFGKNIEEIILDFVADLNIPVCFDFPVGHQPENYALKMGMEYEYEVDSTEVALTEI